MIAKINQLNELARNQIQNITVDDLFAWTLGARLFDLGNLLPQMRSVAWLGYGAIVGS